MSVHDIGDVVTLWSVFRDAQGAQAATTASMAVRYPDGTTDTVTTTEAADEDEAAAEAATGETLSGVVGVYKAELTIDQAGIYVYRWLGEGGIAEADAATFYVRPDPIGDAGS